jgi:hypothetical protein
VEEELSEGLVQNGSVPFYIILRNKRVFLTALAVISTLIVLIGGVLQQVPIGCNEELFGFLESVGLP